MAKQLALNTAEQILLAAADLFRAAKEEFSEWDLTVYAWRRNPNKFGCRGYEDDFPDHKRVMSEIMGTTKSNNPLRKGWMEKTRTNHYRITKLGLAEADRLQAHVTGVSVSTKSTADIYDEVKGYMEHQAFDAFDRNPQDPKTWLGAAAFFGITSYDPKTLNDKIAHAENTVAAALRWLKENSADSLRRGPAGGGSYPREKIVKLASFIQVLQERFSSQLAAIRQRPQKRG